MPFGKFKGTAIADLPADYFGWLCEHTNLREPLRAHVLAELKRRRTGQRVRRAERRGRHALQVLMGDPEVLALALELISAGHVMLAEACHPDHGTDPDLERFERLNLAADAIRQLFEPEPRLLRSASTLKAVGW